MTCWLKTSDSPGPAVGGVHSRSSSYSNSIVVGVSPWSCIGSTAVALVHSIVICGLGPTSGGVCLWLGVASTASEADWLMYPWT